MKSYLRVLTIAGSDPSGGAGIQADLKTFAANGCYGMSVICALTAQNTQGVSDIMDVPPDFVRAQLDAVLSDVGADAVKIGMLSTPDVIHVVSECLRRHGVENIVLDPVMVAKSGHHLLRDDAIEALKSELLPLATIVTPNLPEVEVLTGMRVRTPEEMEAAGSALLRMGARAALIKGGHLEESEEVEDCLVLSLPAIDGLRTPSSAIEKIAPRCHWFRHPRVHTPNTHGTGCTLSSAIASNLASGITLPDAVSIATDYIAAAIEEGAKYTLGKGHGPVNHFPSLNSPPVEGCPKGGVVSRTENCPLKTENSSPPPTAILLLADGAEETEAVTVLDILRRGRVQTLAMSVTPSLEITCSRNVVLRADTLWDDALIRQATMIILPGGKKGVEALRADARVITAIQTAHAEGRYVAAICAAPLVLAHAGLLKGKRATCYPDFQSQLTGARVVSDERVVIDGTIVTSQSAGTSMDFALAIVPLLAGGDTARAVAQGLCL